MDPKKLEELSQLNILEQKNRQLSDYIARSLEANPALYAPTYTSISTFMRAPYQPDFTDCDIAMIGVPFDLGVMHRPGTRLGPREIRSWSALTCGPMHHHTKIIPFDLCKIVDVGDLVLANEFNLDPAIAEIEEYYKRIRAAGVTPLSAGGDHSITYPILKALGTDRPLGVVHIDAHCDTFEETGGSKLHHAGTFRNAVLARAVDPERVIQIGIRGRAEMLWEFSHESGMRVVHAEEFHELGVKAVIEEARQVVGDGPAYITFDIDSISAAHVPGTGVPEVGGLTPTEVQALIRGMRGLNLIGADVVEVAPPYDPSGITALTGAAMMFELLCVLADSVASRSSAAR
jgi:agmatinase